MGVAEAWSPALVVADTSALSLENFPSPAPVGSCPAFFHVDVDELAGPGCLYPADDPSTTLLEVRGPRYPESGLDLVQVEAGCPSRRARRAAL